MDDTLLVAQLGAPTAVVNQTLVGVVDAAREAGLARVLGAHNGVLGLLRDEFHDLSAEPRDVLGALRTTPGAAIGSCRYDVTERADDLRRCVDVLRLRRVRHVVFIGGGGSMAALDAVARACAEAGYTVSAVGAPKTIDNDILLTDHAPGYGSVAKYMATTALEAGRDTDALHTYDTCTVVETMGRDTGWIAAAAGLATHSEADAPHIVLLPEAPLDWARFADAVRTTVSRLDRCVVAVCEGMRDTDGQFLAALSDDPSGQMQFAGSGDALARFIREELGWRCRVVRPGTAQRNATHLAGAVDAAEAYEVGREAVRRSAASESGAMVTLERTGQGDDYAVAYGAAALGNVAGRRRPVPPEFYDARAMCVTDAFRDYATPLVRGRVEAGEDDDGLPPYARLTHPLLPPG